MSNDLMNNGLTNDELMKGEFSSVGQHPDCVVVTKESLQDTAQRISDLCKKIEKLELMITLAHTELTEQEDPEYVENAAAYLTAAVPGLLDKPNV